jgi:hypothetical protein
VSGNKECADPGVDQTAQMCLEGRKVHPRQVRCERSDRGDTDIGEECRVQLERPSEQCKDYKILAANPGAPCTTSR